MNEHLKLAQCF